MFKWVPIIGKGLIVFLYLVILVILSPILLSVGLSDRGLAAENNMAVKELFIAYEGDIRSVQTKNDLAVVRKRYVEVNFQNLPDIPTRSTDFVGKQVLALNLFDDAYFEVIINKISLSRDGKSTIMMGTVKDKTPSSVIIVRTGNILSGNITLNAGKSYQIRYETDNVHSTRELEQSKFPNEAPPIPVYFNDKEEMDTPSYSSDNATTIDVLVVYTKNARKSVGGTTAMQNLITLGETETNEGYENSNITQRINVVHTEELSFDENSLSSMDSVLLALQNKSDQKMDQVHTLRNTYAADLVSLWTDITSTAYCGVAYLMTSLSNSFKVYAFSVVEYDCATGYYTFAHEMGHNMGAAHDRNQSGSGLYEYSHGQQRPNASTPYRTIMAYSCTGSTSCPRVNYWSNPDITLYGKTTGQPTTAVDSADNHSTLNNSYSTIKDFRTSSESTTTVIPVYGWWGAGIFVLLSSVLLFVYFAHLTTMTSNIRRDKHFN
ncbi:MAG: zinc-dependent metalloprotease [Candidatus Magnetoovum sp. WYHC-5]|nr:zinc-dependent metalloprotease [Candidatus Magnetoovum sp. WYHC-5]